MIRSMTGFGRGDAMLGSISVFAEIKSVNSKSLNITVKLPDLLSSFEPHVISYIKNTIKRGQINILIDLDRSELASGNKVIVNRELAKEYWHQLESLRDELSLTDQISLAMLVSFPGVITVEESKESIDQVWSSAYQAMVIAVDQLIHMREVEGSAMLSDINERLESMSSLVDKIKTCSPLVVEEYRQRLQKRLNEIMQNQAGVDEFRLAMEVALMADRCDITEELVRLRSHIQQMQKSLVDSDEPVGRQLDFILQEINREVNTISSKANDYQISADCIQLKYEIEKIREQVQNIE